MDIASWRAGSTSCSNSPSPNRLPPSLSPGPGSYTRRLLEGSAERRLRVVPNLPGNAGDFGAALSQPIRGHLHPPAGEVLHRRLSHYAAEPFREIGPGGVRASS